MQTSGLIFFLGVLIIFGCIHLIECEDILSIDVYVDNKVNASFEDGTKQNPFTNLSYTFETIQSKSPSTSQTNVYIASSSIPYVLDGLTYVIDNYSQLSISKWEDEHLDEEDTSMPTLDLRNSSLFINGLDLFSITAIQVFGKEDSINLNNTTLMVQNSIVETFSERNGFMMNIQQGGSVTLENVEIYEHNSISLLSYSTSLASKSPKIFLQNITVHGTENLEDNSQQLFLLMSNATEPVGDLSITNMRLTKANATSSKLLSLIRAEGFYSILVSNFSLQNESMAIGEYSTIFSLKHNINIKFNGLTLNNNSLLFYSTKPLISIYDVVNLAFISTSFSSNQIEITDHNETLSFLDIFAVKNITLYNQSISNNYLVDAFRLYRIRSHTETQNSYSTTKTSINIDGLVLSNTSGINQSTNLIYIDFQDTMLENLTVKNIEYSYNFHSCQVFSIQPSLPPKGRAFDANFKSKILDFSDIKIVNNSQNSTATFLYFAPAYDQEEKFGCLQPVEAFAIYINNLSVSGNLYSVGDEDTIYQGSLFQVLQAQLHLNNSRIINNMFNKYNLLTFSSKPSTAIITSSEFIANTFNFSQLVMASLGSEYRCIYVGNIYTKTQTPLYRFSFILNSTFRDNTLISSVVLNTANTFIAIHDNKITNEHMMNSQFVATSSLLSDFEPDLDNNYLRNTLIEQSILNDNPAASLVLHEIMIKASQYQSDNIYFTSIYNNELSTVVCNTSKYFSFYGFIAGQSFFNVENNLFSELSMGGLKENPFLSFNNIKVAQVFNNSFQGITGQAVLLALSQSNSSSILNISSNSILYSQASTFIQYSSAILGVLEFSNNQVIGSEIYSNLLSVSVKFSTDNWILDNNTISNTSFALDTTSSQINQFGLFSLFTSNPNDEYQLLISNTTFTGLTVYFGSNIISSARASLFLIQTGFPVLFSKVTMEAVEFLSPGNLITATNSVSFSLKDSKIRLIKSLIQGGLINLITEKVLILNSVFEDSQTDDGSGIFLLNVPSEGLDFKITDSKFNNIKSRTYGSILTALPLPLSPTQSASQNLDSDRSYQLSFKMYNSVVEDVDPILYLSSINCDECLIRNSTFQPIKNNQLISFTGNITGTLTLDDIHVHPLKSTNDEPAPLVEIKNSNITLIIENMNYNGEKGMFNLITLDSGIFILQNSRFSNISFQSNSLISAKHQGQEMFDNEYFNQLPKIIFKNTIFDDFIFIGAPMPFSTILLAWPSDLFSFFEERINSIISVLLHAYVHVEECHFENISLMVALYYEVADDSPPSFAQSSIHIEDTIFRNISYPMGPALTVLPKFSITSPIFGADITIKNSTFEQNKADIGGALFVYNSSLSIIDSYFIHNNATKQADAIYLGGTSESNCNISATTVFEKIKGSNNENIGYEPTGFNVSFVSKGKPTVYSAQTKPFYFSSRYLFISNISSEEFSKGFLQLDFVDNYGNSAHELSENASGNVHIETNSNYDLSTSFNALIIYLNDTQQSISLSNLAVGGQASQTVQLELQYTSERLNLNIDIWIKLRSCLPGEHNNSIACIPCPYKTYSFDPNQTCNDCPANADCVDQSQICPKLGFWNSRKNSIVLHECHPGRCLNDEGCLNCAPGYAGPLCNGCDFDNSYVENGYLKCGKCKDPQMSLIYTIFIGLAYFLYQVFSIYILYSGSGKIPKPGTEYLASRKLERSYYIKSLLTYTQLMSTLFLSSYEIYNTLGLTLQLGNPSALITYGTQCSLTALGIESSDFLYYQICIQVLYPVVQFLTISFVVLFIALFKWTINYKRIIAITALYLVVSNQSGIVNSLGLFLSCDTITDLDYSFVTAHPNWSCDSSQYVSFSSLFVIPSLVIWCGVVPIVFLIILYLSRNRSSKHTKTSLEVLTSGLRGEYYYWGVVLITLKLALSFLVSSLQKKDQTQIFLSLVLLWTYQSLVRVLKPYTNPSFNSFQIVLMNLLMFNIIATQYLFDSSNGAVIPEVSVIVGAVANTGVLVYMSWKILSLTYLGILSFIERRILKRRVERTPRLLSEIAFKDIGNEVSTIN